MMDLRAFFDKIFTPGTVPCAIFGAVAGLLIAILCLLVGVGKTLIIAAFCIAGAFIGGCRDKKAVLDKIRHFFSDDGGTEE